MTTSQDILRRNPATMLMLAGAFVFFFVVLRGLGAYWHTSPQQPANMPTPPIVSVSTPSRPQSATDGPIRLHIPRIGVDAKIERVGLTATGAMDTPRVPEDVAWYAAGPQPGETGSAVIAGHLDGKDGRPAVFAQIRNVRAGDLLSVEDATGMSVSFVVRRSQLMLTEADATDVFSSQTGAHLNLITCAGTWNAAKKSYSERLVVFADRL